MLYINSLRGISNDTKLFPFFLWEFLPVNSSLNSRNLFGVSKQDPLQILCELFLDVLMSVYRIHSWSSLLKSRDLRCESARIKTPPQKYFHVTSMLT